MKDEELKKEDEALKTEQETEDAPNAGEPAEGCTPEETEEGTEEAPAGEKEEKRDSLKRKRTPGMRR